MKKYITYLLATALVGSAFVSCTERLQEGEMRISTHKVHFSASDAETRTGLSIDGTTVTPDWNKTAVESIHLFEIDANDAVAYGETIAITTSEDNATAHFEADFPTEMSIIVDPSDPEEDSGAKGTKGTKGTRVSPYRYAAIIAQKLDKNNFTFVVPAEQHPNAETLKDPDADFLIGYSRKAYDTEHFFDEPVVDLYFDRVAALGRLAISNFAEGEKVQSVTINAQNGLTGSASYADIDFENGSVSFVREEGPGAITLIYDGGMDIPADGPFYAFFVAIPGPTTLTSVEVVTDQYRYTKTIEGGKGLTFSEKAFKSMNLDLSTATREEVAPSGLTWYKASMLEAGYDYLIVSGGQALKNNGNNNVVAAKEVTILENNTIELDDTEGVLWTVANADQSLADNGKFTLKNATEYLYRHGGSSTSTLEASTSPATPKYGVWDYEDGYFFNISTSSGTNYYYVYYDSGWKITTTKTAAMIFTNRAPQTISFAAPGPFEYDLDNPTVDFEEPALSEHFGDVTYFSSDESIATVDPETGNVTFLKSGVVEITATAAGDDSHQAATASYMIVVTTSQIPTWYKADELVDGEVYMIVSNANALRLDGTSLATVANSAFTGDSFQYEADDNLKWTATASSGKFTFKSGNHFLSRSSTNIQTNTSSGATWSYDSAQNYITTAGSSSTYYLYFSESQGKWQVQTSGGDTHKAAVYTMTPALVSRNLSFSAETVTHDLADGEDVNEPELTGDSLEGVTYAVTEGSDVASVNANTGVVSLAGKTGSAVITASAPKTSTYKAESVSYTLIVKNSNIPTKRFVLANSIVAGKNYLIVSSGQALKNNSGTIASEAVTPDNEVIELESGQEANLVWTAASESGFTDNGHFSFTNGNYRFSSSHGSSPSLKLVAVGDALDKYAVWDRATYNGEDYLYHISVGNGKDYHYFAYYKSGWKMTAVQTSSPTPTTTEKPTQLYAEDDGGVTPPTPEKQERNLSFGTDSFSCTLGEAATFPTLSGVTDGVTYSSSNESVATVNTSGVVTAKAAGTTIIKAEAPESDTYLAGSAQYTLTVNAAAGEAKYYVLVTSEPASWDGKYLIVNTAADGTGSAMNGTGTANVTISGGKILSTSTIDGYALTVTSAGEIHPNQTDSNQGLIAYDITFSDGDWLYWYSSKYKQTTENQSSRHNKCTLFYDNGGVRLMSAGYNVNLSGQSISDPSKNYLYYQTSGSYTMSSSHGSDRVQLYKLDDDGTTPGGGDDPQPPTPSTVTYTKVNSITSGATYLIVSADAGNYNGADGTKAFTGDQNGTAATVNNAAGVITGDYTSYEFVISASGSDYTLLGPNGYVTGNANSGSRYIQVSSTAGTMSLSMASDFTGTDGQVADAFYFYYPKTSGTSTSKEVLYFNADGAFKVGGTGRKYGVYLYKKVENP